MLCCAGTRLGSSEVLAALVFTDLFTGVDGADLHFAKVPEVGPVRSHAGLFPSGGHGYAYLCTCP